MGQADGSDLSRRSFLALVALLAGCGSSDDAPAPAQPGAGGAGGAGGSAGAAGTAGAAGAGGAPATMPDVPFGVWQEMLDAIRTSPDHLPAEADRVVASKDPAAIFAFVRDRIATILPVDQSVEPTTWVRWGARATLRGGAGTPREKAELLASLYRKAGFQADVVSGQLATTDLVQAILAQKIDRTFAPKIDQAMLDRWRAAMGISGAPMPPPPLDANDVQSLAIASPVLAALPQDEVSAARWQVAPLASIPLVRVVVNGAPKYASPSVPSAAFGDTTTMAEPQTAPTADDALRVHVTLSASTADQPQNRSTLVERDWGLDDLAGRQVRVSFAPTQDLDVVLRAPARDLATFVPALSVTGQDLDTDASAALSVAGPIVTTNGDVLQPAADGSVQIDGATVAPPGPDEAMLAAKIASISVDVAAQTFPTVKLRVSALDANGAPVSGLSAASFRVDEDGGRAGFLMLQNQVPAVRVMLILDLSGSIPDAYASTMGRATLAGGIADAILAKHPDATFQVMAVSGGSTPTPDGFTLTTSDAVKTAVAPLSSFGSEIWSALAYANAAFPTVIVLVTDGKSDETTIDGFRADVAKGAPVVAAGVGTVDTATMDDIAALSGGVTLLPSTPADVATAGAQLLDRRVTQPYVLRYVAPVQGNAQRTVTVRAPAASVMGQATYTAPAAAMAANPPALASVALTVSMGFDPPVTRVLAGYASDASLPVGGSVSKGLLEDVRGLLLGATILSVEASAPPFSVWLDDLLTARLAAKPFWEAAKNRDAMAIVAALSNGVSVLPAVLPTLHAPLSAEGSGATYEDRPRMVLYTERPRFGGARRRAIDYLSSNRFVTASSDAATGFATTLKRTARLAVAEASLLPKSTASLLAGQMLAAIPSGYVDETMLTALPDALRHDWAAFLNAYSSFHRVFPVAGAPLAFWAIEPATGTLLGVLSDGSGGSFADDTECQVNDIQSLISLIGLFGGLGGFGAVGVWAIFAKLVATNVIRASAAIALMDVPDDYDSQFYDSAEGAACDLIKSAIFSSIPALEALETVDGILDVLHHAMPCGFNAPDTGKLC